MTARLHAALFAVIAACSCTPTRWQPVDDTAASRASDSGTSIRGGFALGEAGVTGIDAIPDQDTELVYVAIEHSDGGAGVGFRGSAFGNSWDLTDEGSASATEYSALSLYPHLTAQTSTGTLRAPIRIGPEVRLYELDAGAGSLGDADYRLFGLAAEIEPEWTFVDTSGFSAALYGRLHVGAGLGTVESPLKDDTQFATSFGGEVGIRLQSSAASISFGFQGHQTRFQASDNGTGGTDPEAELRFAGAFLSIGVSW